jgi:arsenate reductase
MSQRTYNVLFVCKENSSRSIIAEAVLRHWGKERFRAFSAGIEPSGEVDSHAMELLKDSKLPIDGLRSKSWQEFAAPGAPQMDFIISLCDSPAASLKGALPGSPLLAHWTITDPNASRDGARRNSAFRRAFQELETRVRLFVLLRHEPAVRPMAVAQAQAV